MYTNDICKCISKCTSKIYLCYNDDFEIIIFLEELDIASMNYCSLNHTTHQIPSSHVTLMILDKSVDWIYALWLQNHRP